MAVELVKPIGDFACPYWIFHAEEFDDVAGHIHAAGGVDARRDSKSDLSRSKGAATELRYFQQGFEAGIDGRSQAFQSQLGKDAILSGERHRVSDGRNRNHFHERLQQAGSIILRSSPFDQTLRDFEGHTRAAQRFAWIRAARLIGVDHGQRSRNALRARKVMVSDDQVHAQPAGCLRRSKGADPHVNADDQLDTGGGGLLDDVVAHVVAVADAVWNVEIGPAAAQLNRGLEDDDRGRTIHVVVAVNQNRFFVLDGSFDPIDRRLHASHQIRRMQVSKRGSEEALRRFGFADSAHHQQATDCGDELRVFQSESRLST